MFGVSPAQIALLAVLLVVPVLPNLLAIWHIFHREFPTPQEKMAWLAGSIFVPVLGGLAYWIFGRKRGKRAP